MAGAPRIHRWAVLLCCCLVALSAAGSPAPCQSTATGDLRMHRLASRLFGNVRMVRVLVPADYDAPQNAARTYPVLYLLDGQNLFDACLSDVSHHEWRVDETVASLIADGRIPPMIVVGIDHAGKDRGYEYLPYKDHVYGGDARDPVGSRFPDFLTDEVMPLVDSRYRTLTGHDATGIGGSSYGGVAALYALMAKPRRFGYGLIESATLGVGMGQLVRDTNPLIAMPRRVYFGFGGKEVDDQRINDRLVSLVRRVEANFRAAGYDDANLRVVIEPDAAHTETAWAGRLANALSFLYGAGAERR